MESSLVKQYKENLTNEFIKGLEEKGLSWKKGWIDNFHNCENAYGKGYNLLNNFILSMFMSKHNYSDNRFFTFKQAEKLGYQIKKGEKAVAILKKFPMLYDKDGRLRIVTWKQYYTHENLDPKIFDLNKKNQRGPIVPKIEFLFNSHQLDGIELKKQNEIKNDKVESSNAVEIISKNMNVPIINRETDSIFSNGCYYNPREDKIYLPNKERFNSTYYYNATCLHELAHATGAEKRLNRETLKKYHSDPKIRAQEELIAEITSAYMGVYIKDVNSSVKNDDINNHKAYINSWAKLLKEDNNLIIESFDKAEKASEYIENILSNELNKDLDNSNDNFLQPKQELIEKCYADLLNLKEENNDDNNQDREKNNKFRAEYELYR